MKLKKNFKAKRKKYQRPNILEQDIKIYLFYRKFDGLESFLLAGYSCSSGSCVPS